MLYHQLTVNITYCLKLNFTECLLIILDIQQLKVDCIFKIVIGKNLSITKI